MSDRELIQTKRRRGMMLKLIRQGHEEQLARMDDVEMLAMMQLLGQSMGSDQVITMLQDLYVLGYVRFSQRANERTGRVEIGEIELTAQGLGAVIRRKSNDDLLLD